MPLLTFAAVIRTAKESKAASQGGQFPGLLGLYTKFSVLTFSTFTPPADKKCIYLVYETRKGGITINQYGTVVIHLAELIQNSGMTKGAVCRLALMERTQLNKYCKNAVGRIDLDVIARLCFALHCGVDELLEYVPDGP